MLGVCEGTPLPLENKKPEPSSIPYGIFDSSGYLVARNTAPLLGNLPPYFFVFATGAALISPCCAETEIILLHRWHLTSNAPSVFRSISKSLFAQQGHVTCNVSFFILITLLQRLKRNIFIRLNSTELIELRRVLIIYIIFPVIVHKSIDHGLDFLSDLRMLHALTYRCIKYAK